MAEAVSLFLEKVEEKVVGIVDLISKQENEIGQLKDDVGLLKAYLKEMEEKKKKDHQLGKLAREIRTVVYEVEDIIDTWLTKSIQNEARSSIRRSFSLSGMSQAKEVKSIREGKLLPLLDQAKKVVKIGDGSGGVEDPPATSEQHAPIRGNRIVGFEAEEETIIGYLKKEGQELLDVISIIGTAGQGKTTLAWKIYQNEIICNHFPLRVWVHISEEFNSMDVFLQILRKVAPSEDPSSLNNRNLVQTVWLCLEKEEFLLVLDGVWSVDAWNKIKEVLPLENGKSKVLITSRDMAVGKCSKVYTEPHELQFLTEEESWTLLQYEVFGGLGACPRDLEDIGKIVASKCRGVPLTITLVGGVLAGLQVTKWKTVEEEVRKIFHSDETQLQTKAVELSYDNLPYDLRDCFLYMGVFPKDYEIPVKMLYDLWISEGFLLSGVIGSLEEAAEKSLKDLISRNLVQVEKTNHMDKVKTCRVLNVVREFCVTKSQEEGLYQEIRKSNKTGALADELQRSYRLCFRSGLSEFLSKPTHVPHARSFVYFDKQPVDLDPNYLSAIPDVFPKLRVLESRSIKFHQFPTKITKLIHLRYLTLYIDTLIILPEAISQLWNLHTIVVETESGSITMKANMSRMHSLRHLRTKAAIVLASKHEGKAGENLQTLDRLSPESCTEALFKKAKNLKTLGISGKLANILQTGLLRELQLLEKLKLVNSLARDDPLPLLTKNSFPPNLKRLSLTNTFLDWKQMSTLAEIGTLEVLKLNKNAFVGIYWNATADRFPSLKGLLISHTDLVIWEASAECFPRLKSLALENCENLNEIPEAILGMCLERIEIMQVPESVVVSAKRVFEQRNQQSFRFGVTFKLCIGP